ncbi:DUF2989 domain-containing protein [Vibrio sp. HN007]|uniref:DUF2989 domain-containing protein n=1 Tax=Vibrio iocasae TaxID=3098914 RepID=UPI0035D50661
MNVKNPLLLLISTITLTGCFEPRLNTNQLCDKYEQLNCANLNMNDGQCRIARTDLIWHRKSVMDDPTVQNKVKEFRLVSEYQKCLDLAAQIEPTKLGDKKERRFNALMHTYDEQKRLLADISSYDSPEALYFMWTQGDSRAIFKFLRYEKTTKLNTAELQYALATYYITRDKEKTINILHKSLSYGPTDSELIANVVESLASVNQNLKRTEHAYIWVMVGKELGLPIASERNLNVLYNYDDEKRERLMGIAEKVLESIENKNFRSSMVPKLESLQ